MSSEGVIGRPIVCIVVRSSCVYSYITVVLLLLLLLCGSGDERKRGGGTERIKNKMKSSRKFNGTWCAGLQEKEKTANLRRIYNNNKRIT